MTWFVAPFTWAATAVVALLGFVVGLLATLFARFASFVVYLANACRNTCLQRQAVPERRSSVHSHSSAFSQESHDSSFNDHATVESNLVSTPRPLTPVDELEPLNFSPVQDNALSPPPSLGDVKRRCPLGQKRGSSLPPPLKLGDDVQLRRPTHARASSQERVPSFASVMSPLMSPSSSKESSTEDAPANPANPASRPRLSLDGSLPFPLAMGESSSETNLPPSDCSIRRANSTPTSKLKERFNRHRRSLNNHDRAGHFTDLATIAMTNAALASSETAPPSQAQAQAPKHQTSKTASEPNRRRTDPYTQFNFPTPASADAEHYVEKTRRDMRVIRETANSHHRAPKLAPNVLRGC